MVNNTLEGKDGLAGCMGILDGGLWRQECGEDRAAGRRARC